MYTEAIARLPRWFEYVFDTPWNHRAHHGLNPRYIDRWPTSRAPDRSFKRQESFELPAQACDAEGAHLSCRHNGADTRRQAGSQGAFVITAFNRRTHVRAFLVASVAYLNLAHPASAAYTESWMSDHDVKAYAQQVKHPPVAASSAAAVKPGRHTVRSQSKAPVAAHDDAKPAPKAHAAPAKTGNVQHAAGADPKAHVAAKPKVTRAAHTSAAARH